MMNTYKRKFLLLSSLLLSSCPSLIHAQCASPVAFLSAVEGNVELRRGDETTWHKATADDALCAGDTLHVDSNSRGALTLADHTLVRLGASTTVTINGPQGTKGFLVDLIEGITHFMSRVPRTLEVDTPFVNAGVEGTEFLVRVNDSETFVSVYEGKVAMENEAGRLLLKNGQSASAGSGLPPVLQAIARPRDAVQWTLYYPPLITAAANAEPATSPLSQAVALHSRGQTRDALMVLEQAAEVDADMLTYRASLHLDVGQAERALEDVERSLELAPGNGDALALASIMFVVQGESEQALQTAEAAVKAKPDAIAPRLALSYALQARFQLEAARGVMLEAAAAAPDNALVQARLAELHLMFRDINLAREASRHAIALSGPAHPGSAHAHMVQGFTHLVAMDTQAASQSFQTAIELDPSAPLPRLGLGLALIREGELHQGRRAIEIAAILDPGNALVRSYLGKAYSEERRDALADDQYAMAMELDPLDPTPFFYNAILKQADNRPVEALENLRQAIEKNDNRAVYRSRLLLDEDLATRGVSMAGIYNTLGFDRLARIEADSSLSRDPGNYSAHRFLADSYSNLPRHEIARASELLKSQLLQPLNHSPLQPHVAENDLFVMERAGAADAAYNEYHPLFTREAATFQTSILAGDLGTLSDEMIIAGTGEHSSLSFGQYHYESDGFRDNNDLRHDIYNIFGQYAISPRLSVQAEYRHRETDAGDLSMRFDPELFAPQVRNEYERQTGRIGLHYQPAPGHRILLSAINQKLDDLRHDTVIEDLSSYNDLLPFDSVGTSLDTRKEERITGDAQQLELQYLHAREWFSSTYGASLLEQDYDQETRKLETLVVPDDRFIPTPLPAPYFPPYPNVPVTLTSSTIDLSARYSNAYVYFNINPSKNMVWTLGASYDSFEYDTDDSRRINPKAGVGWHITPNTQLRAAWFKTTRRPFTANQTIEPTQVAGFNQFFDETGGSRAEHHGIALDHRVSRTLYVGFGASRRKSEQPRFVTVTTPNVLKEDSGEAYLYWAVNQRLAFSTRIMREEMTQSRSQPAMLNTLRVPIGLSYFGPNGFYTKVTATYVDQNIESSDVVGKDEDRFWNVDASLGYKLPKRLGVIRLGVKNLFDENFHYKDSNYGTSEPLAPEYLPERVILAELRFNAF